MQRRQEQGGCWVQIYYPVMLLGKEVVCLMEWSLMSVEATN